MGWIIEVANPGRGKISRPAVGPMQWVPRALSPRIKRPRHEANHFFHVVPRLMGGTIHLLPVLCSHGVYRGNF